MKPIVLSSLLLSLSCGFAHAADDKVPRISESEQQEYLRYYGLLAEAVARIERSHAMPVDRKQLFEAALRGMLAELDPYSAYLAPEEYAKLKRLGKRSPPSVGVELAIERGRIVVLGVRPRSPAEGAGVLPSDRVLSINGRSTEKMSLAEADRRLASAGPATTLALQDHNGAQRQLTLKAVRQTAPTVVSAQVMRGTVGYVRLRSFAADTAAELREEVGRLQGQGATALVLDLRFNSGGLLQSAIDVADLFLEKGKIVSVVARGQAPRVWNAGEDQASKLPMVVLVNRYSASASEVVAAALKDNGRAAVAGERTFGKGSVQSVIPLGQGASALKLTTAAYVRPNGKNIHRFADSSEDDQWGVSPDQGATLALDAAQTRALLAAWNAGPSADVPDPQLQAALDRLTNVEDEATP